MQVLEVYEVLTEQVIQGSLELQENKASWDILEREEVLVCQAFAMYPCAIKVTTSGTPTAKAPASEPKGHWEYFRLRFHCEVKFLFGL